MTTFYETQEDTIAHHLQQGKSITPLHSLTVYGISRLSSVIERLRKDGMKIVTVMKQDEMGRKYGEYKLAGPIVIGSSVCVRKGYGIGLPHWVRRTIPGKVVGMFKDTALVQFDKGNKRGVFELNIKELNHVG